MIEQSERTDARIAAAPSELANGAEAPPPPTIEDRIAATGNSSLRLGHDLAPYVVQYDAWLGRPATENDLKNYLASVIEIVSSHRELEAIRQGKKVVVPLSNGYEIMPWDGADAADARAEILTTGRGYIDTMNLSGTHEIFAEGPRSVELFVWPTQDRSHVVRVKYSHEPAGELIGQYDIAQNAASTRDAVNLAASLGFKIGRYFERDLLSDFDERTIETLGAGESLTKVFADLDEAGGDPLGSMRACVTREFNFSYQICWQRLRKIGPGGALEWESAPDGWSGAMTGLSAAEVKDALTFYAMEVRPYLQDNRPDVSDESKGAE